MSLLQLQQIVLITLFSLRLTARRPTKSIIGCGNFLEIPTKSIFTFILTDSLHLFAG